MVKVRVVALELGQLEMLAFSAALWSGCATVRPFAFAPSTAPVTGAYSEQGPVSARLCSSVLFGFIPLKPGYTMADLERKTGSDLLVAVTVDERDTWWLVGSTRCHELHATAATRGTAAAEHELISGDPSQSGDARATANHPSSSAYRFTDSLYEHLGRTRPADPAAYEADVAAVASLIASGHDGTTLMHAADAGLEKTAGDKNTTLAVILTVGLAQ